MLLIKPNDLKRGHYSNIARFQKKVAGFLYVNELLTARCHALRTDP